MKLDLIIEAFQKLAKDFNRLTKSQFSPGDPVYVKIKDGKLRGYVRTVLFSALKVRYSVFIIPDNTTLHNIDSVFVTKRSGDRIDFGEDNYS